LDQQIWRAAAFQAESYINDIQKRLAENEAIVSVIGIRTERSHVDGC
jgi:hypothetical protein